MAVAMVPAASAAPVAQEGNTYVGLAHLGSHDRWHDWHPEGVACTTALERHRVTLAVDQGAPLDVLLLEVTAVGGATVGATAMPGAPATVEVVSASGCADFAVRGVLVATVALYTVTVESLGHA